MNYKMFVSDLDGTLLNNNHKISSENIRAINALREKGIKFIVATGRSKYMLEDYLDIIDYKGPFIWSNGAAVSDAEGEVLWAKELEVEDSTKIMNLAREYNMDYVVYTLDGIVGIKQEGRLKRLDFYNKKVKKEHRIPLKVDRSLDVNLHKYRIIKFCFYSEDSDALHKFQKIISENLQTVSGVFSHPTLLDVTRKDATKGEAVLELARQYKIDPKEIAAIGDNQNDISMLKVCGLPLTLENAVDGAKAVAAHITKDNHAAGVADAIDKYIL